MTVVLRAIDGCQDAWEEVALAFCAAVAPEAKKLIRASELREAIRGGNADSEAASAAVDEATRACDARFSEEAQSRAVSAVPARVLIGIGTVLFVLILILFDGGAATLIALGLSVPAIATGVVLASNRSKRISSAEKTRSAAEARLGKRLDELDLVRRRVDEARAELDSMQVVAAVSTVGRVALPVRSISLAGYPAVLDETGLVEDYVFELPNFVYDRSSLDRIAERIDRLSHPPVLLEPHEARDGEIDALHGEELELRGCVDDFAEFVGGIPTVSRRAALVPRACGAGNLPAMRPLAAESFPLTTVRAADLPERLAQIETISAEASDARSRAAQARIELTGAYEGIRALLAEYQTLRSNSMAGLHEHLRRAMERSSWCRVRYYCPKAMQVPRYLYETTGIDIDRVHEYGLDVLMGALLQNEEIALRLSQNEDLRNKIADCKRSVDELEFAVASVASTMVPGGAASPMGMMQVRAGPAASSIASQFKSQLEQSIGSMRQIVIHAVTGSPRPVLEISTQSRLYFDPERGTWSSDVTGTEYAEQHHADMGRLLRLHEDVLFPIWNHLWTEKADFRRSEMFRTNEQLLRMKEKESEKLIEIGNQFRADMRSVREQLKTLVNDLNAKIDQIRSTRDGLAALGLLTVEDMERLSDEVLDEMASGTDGTLEHASAKETILSLEPAVQADRRGSAVDPIDVSRSPSLLFAESAPEALQRTLASRLHAPAPVQAIGLPGEDG